MSQQSSSTRKTFFERSSYFSSFLLIQLIELLQSLHGMNSPVFLHPTSFPLCIILHFAASVSRRGSSFLWLLILEGKIVKYLLGQTSSFAHLVFIQILNSFTSHSHNVNQVFFIDRQTTRSFVPFD